MSFILNALKKAERDRLRDENREIEDFTSSVWEPNSASSVTSKRLIFKIGLILIILFLGVLIFVYVSLKDVTLDDTIFHTDVSYLPIESAPATTLTSGMETENSSKLVSSSVPNIVITGSIFLGEGSISNRVFISDRVLKTGDLEDLNWIVESIEVDAVVLRSDEHTVRILYP